MLEVEDGNEDMKAIAAAIEEAKEEKERPSLIIVKTAIAYGCPAKQGSESSHGSPLGQDNIDAMKKNLGWEYEEAFVVPEEVKSTSRSFRKSIPRRKRSGKTCLQKYEKEYPELAAQYKAYHLPVSEDIFDDAYWDFEDKPMATRDCSNVIINRLAAKLPNLMGGSADLGPANKSTMKERAWFSPQDRTGTNVHFGIREFAMAAMCNGMMLHGGVRPYCATFPRIQRLYEERDPHVRADEAPGHLCAVARFHRRRRRRRDARADREHLAALRATPGVYMWRPADGHETAAAYKAAMTKNAPAAVALSRQNLPLMKETGEAALRGAYILKDGGGTRM